MPHEVFTAPWLAAWAQRINQHAAYKQAARQWEWPLLLILEKDADAGLAHERRVYLDLSHGECRIAREAAPQDFDHVPYALSASLANWRAVLSGELDPLLAIARGKLRLQKGSLFALARHSAAAKQLVATAREVDTLFPGEAASQIIQPAKNGGFTASREAFITTSTRGLRHDILPMRLYHKAKKLGVWDPRDIDFTRDRADWQKLNDGERTVVLHLTTLFQTGEESVTLDLLPALLIMAKENRLEEEMYLSTFLFEEAKHTEFCRRFLDEVTGAQHDLTHFHTPAYRQLFYEELPSAMQALLHDSSPAAQIRAAATYNMMIEGTLAETGYYAYYAMLERNNLMPGLRHGIGLLKRDESRHIAYGIYWLSRLLAANAALWHVLEQRMAILLELGLQSINEVFDLYNPMPFGLQREEFMTYALQQFNARMARLERAKSQTVTEIEQEGEEEI